MENLTGIGTVTKAEQGVNRGDQTQLEFATTCLQRHSQICWVPYQYCDRGQTSDAYGHQKHSNMQFVNDLAIKNKTKCYLLTDSMQFCTKVEINNHKTQQIISLLKSRFLCM